MNTPHNKPAEELARVHYLPERSPETAPTPMDTEVVEAELISEEDYAEIQRRKALLRYQGYRRDALTVYRVARAVATHERTKTAGKAVVRHVCYPIVGAGVVVKRWRDAHGAGRYERMMRAAEAAGDHEALLEWEARDVAEKQRRHDRVMDWVRSPTELVKAAAIGIAAVTALLLGLGVVLAVADSDASKVLEPIIGVIEAIRFTVWFLSAYGALLVSGATTVGVLYLWQVGRKSEKLPDWAMPAARRVTGEAALITPSAVVNALCHLGITDLRKAIQAMEDGGAGMLSPITLAGNGVEVDVTLPRGVDTGEIQKRRRRLAENLDRHEHELFITIPKQARTVRLWIADPGALDEPIEESPLVTATPQKVSMYRDRAPLGRNLRGDEIALNLWQKHLLITGLSNMGKTATVRQLALWLALDPTVELHIADLKGLGDWRMFRGIAKTYIEGPTDEDVIAATNMLEQAVWTMNKRLTSFDADKYPDGVPPDLPGYHPQVFIVDEAQVAFMCPETDEHGWSYGGKSNTSMFFMACRKLLNQGRAVNTLLWLGTQDPTDQNLPKLVREGFHIRASLRVGTVQQSRMALGDAAVNDGASPHELRQEHRGTLVITGMGVPCQQGQTSEIVRSHYVSGTQATKVIDVAKQHRDGQATTDEENRVERDHLADIARVLSDSGQKRMGTTEVLQRLVTLDEVEYRPWTHERLTRVLKTYGAAPYKSNGVMVVSAARVQDALTERDEIDLPEGDGDDIED